MSLRRSGSFKATGSDGNEYSIIEYNEPKAGGELGGTAGLATGRTKLFTEGGVEVTPVIGSGNRLQILNGINWITVTTTDPRWQNL